jgi:hypothetical protein
VTIKELPFHSCQTADTLSGEPVYRVYFCLR